ncbi:GGDEF domain-containing protein [Marinomonas sp. M1K-6]|uniref:diguanylate cyclase n=1 Tax=Marinomonas profundi TaxID=2726122 RepID=A0A847R4T2_9GAMM|nr:GGDEF domain-containing protein [Marinomonas profundi]NLQ17513.1 GGDEF domain-containing protein [Marinomonas profundi]UDV02034.1 GGDEF domain-containing protein [Marinomonas profundi]
MTEPSSDKLIEVLRKAVSRTSMLAEGNDPQLDSVVRQIRQTITKGANAEEIQKALNNAEPFLIQSDEAHLSRAKQVRSTLQDLIDILEKQDDKQVPQSEKKQLEAKIRLHWQQPSQWPLLLKDFLTLAENTLNQPATDHAKSSFFKRLLNRSAKNDAIKNTQDIIIQVSHTLAGLLNNLSLPSIHDNDIADLKTALSKNDNLQQFPDLLDETINLVMVAVGKNQESLTNYLNQLNKQLASINESITHSDQTQKSLSKSREGLNTKLQQQMKDTSKAVQEASELNSLKSLINERLSTISTTMTAYRSQMKEQEKQSNQSIALLKNKVTRMEKDTTSLRALLQEKLAQAMTDSLTDLPNRTAYQDAILPLCKAMQKAHKPICLVVCDIDHFKKVNDTWGHLAGDKVLRLVPKQIRNMLTKEDLMFRYGGEEFVMVFPDTTLEKAIERAENVRLAVTKTPFNVQGEPVSISVSIGVAELQPQEDPESLFDRADKQLYLAKDGGRNKVMAHK